MIQIVHVDWMQYTWLFVKSLVFATFALNDLLIIVVNMRK